MTPAAALKAARQLVGQWPQARPPDPETYAGALGAVLAGYPAGVVEECCDPRSGLARSREFPPTVASIVEWCDRHLQYHRTIADYRPPSPVPPRPEPTPEQRARIGGLMRQLARSLSSS